MAPRENRMLSYEEELEISDRLVARRRVQDICDAENRYPTRAESFVIEDGDKAAQQLIEAYSPYIHKIAEGFYRRVSNAQGSPTAITSDDLFQEGALVALKCTRSYNLRGKNGEAFSGLRFANYATRAINKAMSRYLMKMATLYRVKIDTIQISIAWEGGKAELRQLFNREPTVQEIEDFTGISQSEIDLTIPARSTSIDVDDSESGHLIADSPKFFTLTAQDKFYAQNLHTALVETFGDNEVATVAAAFLGLDRGVPRDREEVFIDYGTELGLSRRDVFSYINTINHALLHPRYRVKLARSLQRTMPEAI